jgi:hypothetical protein
MDISIRRAPACARNKKMAVANAVRSSIDGTIAALLIAGVCAYLTSDAVAQQPPQQAMPKAMPTAERPKPADSAASPSSALRGKKPTPQKPTIAPSTSQQAPARADLPPLPPIDASAPPPMLPRATRERMRACAEEWERTKLTAKSGLPMWRDFAAGCLTR